MMSIVNNTIIRELRHEDIFSLKRIHEKYYKDEFEFPDFSQHFLGLFSVTENDKIVVSGGVRTITEAIIITNQDVKIEQKREALHKMLQACMFTCGRHGYDELHAFIQNEKWLRHLQKVGFSKTKGKSLVLEVY